MARKIDHSFLDNARQRKNDEFYTQLSDIERELAHYEGHFAGKKVYCNCDDPAKSNFFRYFADHFHRLGLKKVVASCIGKRAGDLFAPFEPGCFYEYAGDGSCRPTMEDVRRFAGDGDFRSSESIELLKEADIVVTNPPFSLFREFIAQMVQPASH